MKNRRVGGFFSLIAATIFGLLAFLLGYILAQNPGMKIHGISSFTICILATALLVGFVCLSAYIILQKGKTDKKLIFADKMYKDLISNIQGGVITCAYDTKSSSFKTHYINDGWTQITGYTLNELNEVMGGNPQSIVVSEDKKRADEEYFEQTSRSNRYKLQYRVKTKTGNTIWVIDKGIVAIQNDGIIQNQSIITEVTEIKENEEHMRKLAQTDPLTGLCNKMEAAIAVQEILTSGKAQLHALMVLDIDNFKGINDSLGHIFGDTVLIEVSTRLKRLFRNCDVIGRIGGDEFLIFMKDISTKSVAQRKANEVCATFRNTYVGETGQYKISCSLGIVFSNDGEGYQDLFNKADVVLYKAKTKGKDQYIIYNQGDEMQARTVLEQASVDRRTNENKFREKDSGELEVKERFFELLYGSVDFDGSINMALALLGRMMEVGRVYVFENSSDNQISSITYEWCGDGIIPVKNKFKAMPIANLGYLDLFDENGIFYCSDLNVLPDHIKKLWDNQNACSFMQVSIVENGQICGFIGFDDFMESSSRTKENSKLMIFAAKVIGIFILKKRAEEQTQLYNQSKMDALDSLPNYIYVIDDSFNIHYMNKATQEKMPTARLGDVCYKTFMKNDAPCEGCPALKCGESSASTDICNLRLKLRLISNASKVTWLGQKNTTLICCHDITNLGLPDKGEK